MHCIIKNMAARKAKKRRNIQFTYHAKKRLKEFRQLDIYKRDVIRACYHMDWVFREPFPEKTKIKGLVSEKGRIFDMVIVDVPQGIRIVTIIGNVNRKGELLYEV